MFKNLRKIISLTLITAFIGSSLYVPDSKAGEMVMPIMPTPGTMVNLSPEYSPAYLKGIVIHPDNALKFDFLVHKGDGNLDDAQKNQEYNKLIKYFLASLTVPENDQWVNLSPYEKNHIIKDDFGKTEMGRDLLSQDYLLKQITSSLMYPESALGKAFWDKVYQRAYKEFGTTDIPVNTFNKVWIVPDDALIYENGNTAYVVKSHLKVMLEEDYLSLKKHAAIGNPGPKPNALHSVSSKVIKEVILPEIEREVNQDKNFAMLRQVFSGMVLAAWYKQALKESLLGKIYADKAKVRGVDQNPKNNQAIYQKYLAAFKKGVYNYIKEDDDQYTNQVIPRKYFAGGFDPRITPVLDRAQVSRETMNAALADDDAALTMDRAAVVINPAQLPQSADQAMVINDLKPYESVGEMYKQLPATIKNIMDSIFVRPSPEALEPTQMAAVTGLMELTRRLYEKMRLTVENYHNHLHHLMVAQGSLILAANAGLIKEKRDLIVTYAAALWHDFHLREVRPGGESKPASPAWVYETVGRPGTNTGGQLPDLLGVNNFKYENPAIGNARYLDLITRDEKRNFQRAFRQLVGKDNPDQVYAEIAAVIYRTDYVSEIPPANDTYKSKALKIRNDGDVLVNGWTEMSDDNLNALVGMVKDGYENILAELKVDNNLTDADRETQLNWLNRQRDVELNFLEALRKVEQNRRIRIYQIANMVELADQSSAAWMGSVPIAVATTQGLIQEIPVLSLEANFPGFYEPNLTNKRVLPRLNYLPLNFKANFIKIMDYFAGLSTKYATKMKNAVNAGMPQKKFENMMYALNRWKVERENVFMDWGTFEDYETDDRGDRIIKQQDPAFHEILQVLTKNDILKAVSLTDLYYMLKDRIFTKENWKKGQQIIRQGQNVGIRAKMYFIFSGSVKVIQDGIVIKKLGPGDNFGEMTFISRLPRNATIEAGDEGVVLESMQGQYLQALRLTNPSFNRLLLDQIPGRLRPDLQESLPNAARSEIIMKMLIEHDEAAALPPGLEPGITPSDEILYAGQYKDLVTPVLEELRIKYQQAMADIKMVAITTRGQNASPGTVSPVIIYEDFHHVNKGRILVFSNELFKPEVTLEDRISAADQAFDFAMNADNTESAQSLGERQRQEDILLINQEFKLEENIDLQHEPDLTGIPNKNGHLMAVFDGHGRSGQRGDEIAQRVKDEFTHIFSQQLLNFQGDVERALRGTFMRLSVLTRDYTAGTTATVSYTPEGSDKIYYAVLGDSPFFVVKKDGSFELAPMHTLEDFHNNPEVIRLQRYFERNDGSIEHTGIFVRNDAGEEKSSGVPRALGSAELGRAVLKTPDVGVMETTLADVKTVGLASDGILRNSMNSRESIGHVVEQIKSGMSAEDIVNDTENPNNDNRSLVLWHPHGKVEGGQADAAMVTAESVNQFETYFNWQRDNLPRKLPFIRALVFHAGAQGEEVRALLNRDKDKIAAVTGIPAVEFNEGFATLYDQFKERIVQLGERYSLDAVLKSAGEFIIDQRGQLPAVAAATVEAPAAGEERVETKTEEIQSPGVFRNSDMGKTVHIKYRDGTGVSGRYFGLWQDRDTRRYTHIILQTQDGVAENYRYPDSDEEISIDSAQMAKLNPGGIDLNSANLAMVIKRDGNGVPLPVSQQDLAQLAHISGFVPKILEIKPFSPNGSSSYSF